MSHFLPFVLFAFVASITPGPTNLLAMSSSARVGMAAAWPIIWGGCAASASIVLLVGLGLGATLLEVPWLQTGLGLLGASWLSYLGWSLFNSPTASPQKVPPAAPIGWRGAAIMQLINPKPWTVSLAVVTVFMPTPSHSLAWQLALTFFAMAVPCMTLWAWMGTQARNWLDSPHRQRRFNQWMGLLLAGSAWLGLLG